MLLPATIFGNIFFFFKKTAENSTALRRICETKKELKNISYPFNGELKFTAAIERKWVVTVYIGHNGKIVGVLIFNEVTVKRQGQFWVK